MLKLAKSVEITSSSFKIDGEEFPWFVTPGGIVITKDRHLTTITLTIPCESVRVDVENLTEE